MEDEIIDKLLLEISNSDQYFYTVNQSENPSEYIKKMDPLIYLKDELKLIRLPFDTNYITLTPLGAEVIEKGGWIQYKKWKSLKEDLELKKTKIDLDLSEKTLKEFPKTKWFARIGFIIAILLALKELYILIFQK
ncbi:hypothetical protein Q4553_10630 [Tenacibaculum soleae]|uniref:hypothetical protein n=1 Tax=Tenacibaculum soleae TaxID=447689 RepID=UPI0026E2897F|nr:hypothetical protein [Tenacibaculum soleae]MDO6745030.1 hypothetical protein [Tenacibaculum soleae]